MSEKKRLTLTGNKMPDDIYNKLEELGNQRKLTPYVLSLIEKEEKMDMLIEHLTVLVNKVDNVERGINDLNKKLESTSIQTSSLVATDKINVSTEIVQEGKLDISDRIEGGIEEEIDTPDF